MKPKIKSERKQTEIWSTYVFATTFKNQYVRENSKGRLQNPAAGWPVVPVRFRPVSIVLNNDNRPKPDGNAGQPAVWVLKPLLMSYPIRNWNSSRGNAKLRLFVAMIFPDPLRLIECILFQVLVFPASLSSPAKYTTDIVLKSMLRWFTKSFHDKSNNLRVLQDWSLSLSLQWTNLHFQSISIIWGLEVFIL